MGDPVVGRGVKKTKKLDGQRQEGDVPAHARTAQLLTMASLGKDWTRISVESFLIGYHAVPGQRYSQPTLTSMDKGCMRV